MTSGADSFALNAQIQQALARRDPGAALRVLAEAEAAQPQDAELKLQKAMALRLSGDLTGAVNALDQALALEPYNFVALLSKASLIERMDGEKAATPIYKNALTIAPETPPPALAAPIAHAREVVARTADALEAYLEARVGATDAALDTATRARFAESLKIFTGKARNYESEAVLLKYPRLPAIPFFDRAMFPWFPELEAATDMIRGELEQVLHEEQADFVPYIQTPEGAPVNQWAELNYNPRWSTYFLWKDGVKQEAACAKCPGTAALMDRLPLARQDKFAPTVMFSALAANTRIPPHSGSTNTRLLVHLPLILPGPAWFRVGNETRYWKMGEAWAFDDSIDHEAVNEADALRVILIIDIWNPLLTEVERELITRMMNAKNEFFSS